jgi:two-component system copper resistance phosphate regulon response regulator CusR
LQILLLEDDLETARAVSAGLERRGFTVSVAGDFASARRLIGERRFDAAVLDVMVPGGSGLDVLRAIRDGGSSMPVLLLTARDRVEDRVDGLGRGADDYLVKPFAFVELAARIEALLRRPARLVEPLRIGRLEIEPVHRRALFDGVALDLTPKEYELLAALAERAGDVLSRKEILEQVWGYKFDPGTNVVDVHVTRLRRKLEDAGAAELIRTIRGVGYALEA